MGAIIYDQISFTYCSIIAPKDIQDKRGLIFCKSKQAYINALEGYLVKIEREDGEYEGQETHKLKFYLAESDGSNTWVLTAGRNSFFTRAVINSLASLDEIGWVRITPYISESQSNNKKYIQGAIRHNPYKINLMSSDSFKVKKKYMNEEIPLVDVISIPLRNGSIKEELDSSARDEFYEKLIDEVITTVKNSKASAKIIPIEHSEEVPF